jgi:hypothetical protein
MKIAKKTLRISIAGSVLVIALSSARVLQDNGIAGYTGSPSEQNCTSCHNSFALNSGGGSISIATTPSISASGYVPGTTYTVDVTVAKTGVSLFGFGAEILGASNANAGTLSVLNATQTKLLNSGSRTNVVHQLNGGASSDQKTFSFKWVAPATAGAATIYAAGVAANGNNQNSSDYVYKISLPVSSTVGMKEQGLDIGINLYPNPASELIMLSYSLTEAADVKCTLTALNGQLVANYYSKKQEPGVQNEVLDVPASVNPGLYLLNLTVNGEAISRRILID